MKLHADFSQPVLLHTASMPWVDSPMAGVQRRMLDRIGAEVARATSIVRYAPGSRFSPHTHDGGEEFVVLEGVFQDEVADYPAGSYVRNPPGTRHSPRSDVGCTIFVKLWQFDPDDPDERESTVMDLTRLEAGATRLVGHAHESVTFLRLRAGEGAEIDAAGGAELLVLDGSVLVATAPTLWRHDWLRVPPSSSLRATATTAGAALWVKTGHLRRIRVPPGVPGASGCWSACSMDAMG